MPSPSKPKPTSPQLPPQPDAGESHGAVATTVAWMLLTLSCAAAQLVGLAMWALAESAGIPANRPNALLLVSGTLLFVAILTGVLVLALTPLVYRVRKARPPLIITLIALALAAAPIILLIALAIVPLLKPEP